MFKIATFVAVGLAVASANFLGDFERLLQNTTPTAATAGLCLYSTSATSDPCGIAGYCCARGSKNTTAATLLPSSNTTWGICIPTGFNNMTFVSGGLNTTLFCGISSLPTTYKASLTACNNGTCTTGCCTERKLNLNGTIISGYTACQPAGETTVFSTLYASNVTYFGNQTVAITSTCPADANKTNTGNSTTGSSSSSFIKASFMMVFALVAAMFF
jgi:hypothetical protein